MNDIERMSVANDLTLVHHAIGGFGYNWDEFAVWTDGVRFFWLQDAGCSCSYFMEFSRALIEELQVGDKQAALKAAQDWNPYGYEDARVYLIKAIRDYR